MAEVEDAEDHGNEQCRHTRYMDFCKTCRARIQG